MEAVALVEPVYYIVHNGIKINAGYFKHFLESMMPNDNTVFDKNDPEEAAMLDLIRAEKKLVEAGRPEGFIGYEYDLGDTVRIEWCGDYDELIDGFVAKIDEAIEKARKG